MSNWQLEWFLLDHFANAATLHALSAHHQRFVGTVWQRAANSLQVRLELSARNTGHFGTHTTQILRLTASLNTVTSLDGLAADFAVPSHLFDLETKTRTDVCRT